MKTFLFLAAMLASISVFTACASSPEAQFTMSADTEQAPSKVQFTNLSKNADEFHWDFGDGATTTTATIEESVTYEYTKAGTHTVTLTAINEGDTSTVTSTVTVEPGPLSRLVLDTTHLTLTPLENYTFSAEALD